MPSRQHRLNNEPHICDGCGKEIPNYRLDMGGSGYESAEPHHYHWCKIWGQEAWMPIMSELCLECYRVDYAKRFPGYAVLV